MLERNLLSHVRLATLLLLLSSSLLLNARLPSDSDPSGGSSDSAGRAPLASLQFVGALTAIGAGVWEYRRGYKDMQDMKGFLMATKYVSSPQLTVHALTLSRPHFYVMSAVAVLVFATCIALIADRGL
jgi:hypothetical protein